VALANILIQYSRVKIVTSEKLMFTCKIRMGDLSKIGIGRLVAKLLARLLATGQHSGFESRLSLKNTKGATSTKEWPKNIHNKNIMSHNKEDPPRPDNICTRMWLA
jgi:hypothetical protein